MPNLAPQNPLSEPSQLYFYTACLRAVYFASLFWRESALSCGGLHTYFAGTISDPSVPAWMAAHYSDDTQLVCIEGTTGNFPDPQWSGNMFAVGQTAFPGVPGKVNQYFGNCGALIANNILAVMPPAARMTIIGHSLGGACAAIAAHRVHAARPGTVQAVVTFGAPRAGNLAWALSQPWPVLRIVNVGDLVTNMPPHQGWLVSHLSSVTAWGPCQQYVDAGTGVSFDQGGQIGVDASQGIFDSVWGIASSAWAQGLSVNALPHSIGNYALRQRYWHGGNLPNGGRYGLDMFATNYFQRNFGAIDGFVWPGFL